MRGDDGCPTRFINDICGIGFCDIAKLFGVDDGSKFGATHQTGTATKTNAPASNSAGGTHRSHVVGGTIYSPSIHPLGNAEAAAEQLRNANDSAAKELDDSPAWNRRLTLQLLRKEAEALITPAEDSDQSTRPRPEGRRRSTKFRPLTLLEHAANQNTRDRPFPAGPLFNPPRGSSRIGPVGSPGP